MDVDVDVDELSDIFSRKMSFNDVLRHKIEQYPQYRNMLIKTYNFWIRYGGNFPNGGNQAEFSNLLETIILIMNSSDHVAFGRTKRRSRKRVSKRVNRNKRRSRKRT
jgi:hypothetical protein